MNDWNDARCRCVEGNFPFVTSFNEQEHIAQSQPIHITLEEVRNLRSGTSKIHES